MRTLGQARAEGLAGCWVFLRPVPEALTLFTAGDAEGADGAEGAEDFSACLRVPVRAAPHWTVMVTGSLLLTA